MIIHKYYNKDNFPFDAVREKVEIVYKRKVGAYIDSPMTFDIETTTLDKETAFMYHWQFCVYGIVCFGRTWEELMEFLHKLDRELEDNIKVIYVHNLAFEFVFMNEFMVQEFNGGAQAKGLFMDINKPLFLRYGNFEFRCSYKLANMRLESFIKDMGLDLNQFGKLDGVSYDYDKVRTPLTNMTSYELEYCYRDVRGLYEALLAKFAQTGENIITVPYTSTGYVRRDVRKAMRKNRRNRSVFKNLSLSVDEYEMMRDAFRGGNTFTNYRRLGVVWENVTAYDIKSSYPYVMMTQKFPMTKFTHVKAENMTPAFYKWMRDKDKAICARIRFSNIRLKDGCFAPYISKSKCAEVIGSKCFNGRIMSACSLVTTITEIDIDIIKGCYTFDEFQFVGDVLFAGKDYLPVEFTDKVYEYFYKKESNKKDTVDYALAKALLNAMYGMTVTNILNSDLEFDGLEFEDVSKTPDELLEKYYKSYNSFLSYQWGVWVTAYARKSLQEGIDVVGGDLLYCDTDSVYTLGDHDADFEAISKRRETDAVAAGRKTIVQTNNKRSVLGVFSIDGKYKQFKTLGAKKYVVVEPTGKLKVTVAGLAKAAGSKALEHKGGITQFIPGTIWGESESGRTVAYYNHNVIHTINVDGEMIETAGGISIMKTTYSLGVTNEVGEFLEENVFKHEKTRKKHTLNTFHCYNIRKLMEDKSYVQLRQM